MSLLDTLTQFSGGNTVGELEEKFSKMASAFLYGGYINVNMGKNDVYKVYIRTVEFYFHSERTDGVHDPIVYHRNGRGMEKIPYFPLMTLHAHNSGFDITFESEKGEYRASALIRAYEVKKNDRYLKWISGKGIFEEKSEYCYNIQSTCLYLLLNGFTMGENNNIRWVNVPYTKVELKGKPRKNVFISESETEYIKTPNKCQRKWSFTREDKM